MSASPCSITLNGNPLIEVSGKEEIAKLNISLWRYGTNNGEPGKGVPWQFCFVCFVWFAVAELESSTEVYVSASTSSAVCTRGCLVAEFVSGTTKFRTIQLFSPEILSYYQG